MIKRITKYAFLIVVGAVIGVLPLAMADEGAESSSGSSESKGSFLSGIKNAFSEIGNEDAGIKPKVRPHFSASSGWISDADLTTKKREGAWQGRVAPGLAIELPFGEKWYNEIDYTYGFSTTQGPSVSTHANTHNINVLSSYQVSKDTVVGASNNAQWSELPGSAGGDVFFLETANAQVSHRITEKIEGKIWDTFQYFVDPSNPIAFGVTREQTFSDNGLGTSIAYDVTDKAKVTPDFLWNVRKFNDVDEKSYWQIQPKLAASYQLGPKTSVGGNFGWAHRNFDESDATEDELIYGGSISHIVGRKLVWAVDYQKSLQDTFNTAFVNDVDNPEATNLDVFDGNFRVIKSHRIGSTATYRIDEKNSVSAFIAAQFSRTDADDNVVTHQKNNEKLMETGIRYAYRITRYLSLDIGYAFGRRFSASNNPSRDTYTFHKISGGVNVAV